jgi:hypothetical protein
MSAPTTAAVPTNRPDPHQDRPATGADAPSRTGRLLGLVRALIDYGRQLAGTLQLRIPMHRGHLLRFDRGQATDLMAATIPI